MHVYRALGWLDNKRGAGSGKKKSNFSVKTLYEASFFSYEHVLLLSSKFSAFILFPFFHLLYCDLLVFHFVLQKRSPNACPIPKVKVKSSPMIEKLQVGPGRAHMAAPAN